MTASSTARVYNSPKLVERQANILEAARRALTEKGFLGVTMQDIAERADVTRKTLYNTYGSRDDLLLAAILEVVHGYRDLGDDVAPGVPAIIAIRRGALRQVAAAPDYARAMTMALLQAGPQHTLTRVLIDDAIRRNRDELARERDNGGLVDGIDLDAAAAETVGQSWGVLVLGHTGTIPSDELEARSLTGLLRLLLGITRGARRRWLEVELEAIQAATPAKRG